MWISIYQYSHEIKYKKEFSAKIYTLLLLTKAKPCKLTVSLLASLPIYRLAFLSIHNDKFGKSFKKIPVFVQSS